jgi:hypothetical protein
LTEANGGVGFSPRASADQAGRFHSSLPLLGLDVILQLQRLMAGNKADLLRSRMSETRNEKNQTEDQHPPALVKRLATGPFLTFSPA